MLVCETIIIIIIIIYLRVDIYALAVISENSLEYGVGLGHLFQVKRVNCRDAYIVYAC